MRFIVKTAAVAIVAAVAAFCAGCDKFEYHPYADDVSYSNLNAKALEQIEQSCAGKATIRFVWTGDTQRFYDETEALVAHVNRRIEHAGDIDFVLHGGDLTDFGLVREYEWMHRKLKRLKVPYAAIVGNHDLQGNGCSIFREMYGPLNFSFIAGNVKFVCLNTNYQERDKVDGEAIPDFRFIRDELEDSRTWTQTIVAMHVGPDEDDVEWDASSEHIFQEEITRFPGLQCCLHAHSHHFKAREYFNDGVMYYCCEAAKYRKYLVFTITPTGYSYEEVEY